MKKKLRKKKKIDEKEVGEKNKASHSKMFY